MDKTKVIFRYWKKDVIAIFPEELGDTDIGNCSSYQHIGQHGSCNPKYIIETSRPATPDEYNDLKTELESIGYNLEIVKKNKLPYFYVRLNKILNMAK